MKKFIKKIVPSWKIALFAVAGLCVVVALMVGALVLYLSKDLPSIEQIDNRQMSQSTKIYDRTGKVPLYELSAGERRTVIPFQDIPSSLKNATIAIEDERFYENPAFDWRGYVRALWVNIIHGEIRQGGSTITIQLARNAFLSTERTVMRKVRELVLAIYLSKHYSKDEILTLYLNEIPYGSTFYGVETAANAYFGKSAKDLTLAQSAVIASIPKAPTYYLPWGSHVAELLVRERLVLSKMRSLNMISQKELDGALAEKIEFRPQGQGIKAPHFVLMVQDYLVKKYGEDTVRRGGLSVVTTLDWPLQQIAEKAVGEGAKRNESLYGGKNAALVAEDPRTGQIFALVGSRDYFDIKNEGNFNTAVQGLRQPGSALKPFAYLTAFTKGYTPNTVLFDVSTEFASNRPDCPAVPNYKIDTPDCFHPQNFDTTFRGPVSLRNALAQSVNIPAVKVLYLAGVDAVLDTLKNFGITTLTDRSRYGLSVVLGGGEVRLSELVGAYGVLANEGVRHNQAIVLEVKNASGEILESYADHNEQVAEPQNTRIVTDILSDQNARAGLFGASLNLTVFPEREVALKTGTSNDYRDAWTIGYTPSLVVGVWAGNNNNTPMHRQGSSILAAVPIWNAFMKGALLSFPNESFTRPDPTTPANPALGGEYAPENHIHTILYWIDRKNPTGPPPTDPTSDPQFNNWETAVLGWANANRDTFGTTSTPIASTTAGTTPTVKVESPQNGSFVQQGMQFPVWARVLSSSPLTRVRVTWNNAVLYSADLERQTDYQLLVSLLPQSVLSQNTLTIEGETESGAVGSASVVVYKK